MLFGSASKSDASFSLSKTSFPRVRGLSCPCHPQRADPMHRESSSGKTRSAAEPRNSRILSRRASMEETTFLHRAWFWDVHSRRARYGLGCLEAPGLRPSSGPMNPLASRG